VRSRSDPNCALFFEMSAQFGSLRLRTEKNLVRLKAACTVAESYQYGLAHRIGARPFTWESLAQLLSRLFPLPILDIVSRDLRGVGGVRWHE